jgi:hypothetical protein
VHRYATIDAIDLVSAIELPETLRNHVNSLQETGEISSAGAIGNHIKGISFVWLNTKAAQGGRETQFPALPGYTSHQVCR